jgi:hypothetical protein
MTITFDDSTKVVNTSTYLSNGVFKVVSVTTYTDGGSLTATIYVGSAYSFNYDGTIKSLIVYNGDGSYSTYAFTYVTSSGTISYSKVVTSVESATTTTTGSLTPTYTYNDDDSIKTMSLTFDDSSYGLFTYSYLSDGTIYNSISTTYTDGSSITTAFYIGAAITYTTGGTMKSMIVYYGDASYATYTFTYTGAALPYSKVTTSVDGTTATTTGTLTPTLTFNTNSKISYASITFTEATISLTYTYLTSGATSIA